MTITHSTVKVPGNTLAAVLDWNANHTGDLDHGTELTNVTSDQHHAKSHAHDGIDGSGTVAHSDTTGKTVNDHHDEAHNAASHSDIASTGAQIDDAVAKKHDKQHAITTAADHTSAATPNQILQADANGLPVDATNTDAQVSATVTASHAKQHAIDSAVDHTSTITENNLMDGDANGLPDDSGLTVANTSDAITKKHTQGTDTTLGNMTAVINMNTHQINGVVDPINPQDAATKYYVDQATGADITVLRAPFDIVANTSIIAAAGEGIKIKVIAIAMHNNDPTSGNDTPVRITDGDGGNDLYGGPDGHIYLVAQGGFFGLNRSINFAWFETSANTALYLNPTAGKRIAGCVWYIEEA